MLEEHFMNFLWIPSTNIARQLCLAAASRDEKMCSQWHQLLPTDSSGVGWGYGRRGIHGKKGVADTLTKQLTMTRCHASPRLWLMMMFPKDSLVKGDWKLNMFFYGLQLGVTKRSGHLHQYEVCRTLPLVKNIGYIYMSKSTKQGDHSISMSTMTQAKS